MFWASGRRRGLVPQALHDTPVADFINHPTVHSELHLPGTKTVICVGYRIPAGQTLTGELSRVVRREMEYTGFRVAHYLDIRGYSAISSTNISDSLVAQHVGVYRADTLYMTILTSAELEPGVIQPQRGCLSPAHVTIMGAPRAARKVEKNTK